MDNKKSKRKVSLTKHHHKSKEHCPDSYIDFNSILKGFPRITLGKITQEELECVIGVDVTSDHPWKFVPKELFLDSITYNYESEFLPLRLDILIYPRDPLLLVYIPDEIRNYDEFVLCLTEESEDKILKSIEQFQKAVEGIVARALYRDIHPWKSLGSEKEIEEYTERSNRPLLSVEIEATYPIMYRKMWFKIRRSEDVCDGYIELLQSRSVPLHINKLLQSIGVQVAPCKHENVVQTLFNHKQSVATQHGYETVFSISSTSKKSVNSFLLTKLDIIYDQISVNSKINFYTNDYLQLEENDSCMKPPKISKSIDLITFSDFNVAKNKLISSVCWHPILTGTVAIAYSLEASNVSQRNKPKLDRLSEHEVNTVLIWCTTDELYPKLRLVCTKQITCISFCPFNENIIVGTCTNGQVVLWDIKNKLEQVEDIKMFTARERKCGVFMSLFMGWMKNVYDKSCLSVTAESDLRYSHIWPAVGIEWLPPYCRINEFGKYELIAHDEPESLQFVTCALDGSIFFWDLLVKPASHHIGSQVTSRKVSVLSAWAISDSPFRVLNRTVRPIYRLISKNSKKNKPLLTASIITSLVNISYEQDAAIELPERVAHKLNIKRPSSGINVKPEINCGTCDGYFFKASWESDNVRQGNTNQEPLIVISIGKYHDGPVTSISRHPNLRDTYLTVGGKVFAIWTDNLKNRPVFWRKSRQRYLHGVWEIATHESVILSTDDGRKEVWVLTRRNDTFHFEQHLSGRMVLGIYLYPFTLDDNNSLGVAHHDGTFEIIYLPRQLKQMRDPKDNLRILLNREVERKKVFLAWQNKWNENHQETILKRNAEINIYKQNRMLRQKHEEEQRKIDVQTNEEKILLAQKQAKPRSGQYLKYAYEQWHFKEEENMRKMLQMRARLPSKKILEHLKGPLKQIEKEEEELQKKLKKQLQKSERIFQESLAMKFPGAIKQEPSTDIDPYAGGDTISVKNECILEYLSDKKTAEKYVEENPYEHAFHWTDLLQTNMDRRRSTMYLRKKSHRERLYHKKIVKILREVEN